MIEINIAKDFTVTPGARYYTDGPFSGEEFFDKILNLKFTEATTNNVKLKIILDGTDGYASSFLNEAFSKLGNQYGAEVVWDRLLIISNEVPKYLIKVKEAIYEIRK